MSAAARSSTGSAAPLDFHDGYGPVWVACVGSGACLEPRERCIQVRAVERCERVHRAVVSEV